MQLIFTELINELQTFFLVNEFEAFSINQIILFIYVENGKSVGLCLFR